MKRLLFVGLALSVGLLLSWMVNAVVIAESANTANPAWQTEVVDDTDCWFPSLALDSNGQPRISYGALGELKYAQLNGATWDLEFVEEQPGATGWYSSLAIDANDNPHISYFSPYSSSLMYARYYSSSWHIDPVTETADLGGLTSLALDNTGKPHIAYWDSPNLTVQYTFQDGHSWHFEPITTMTGSGQNVSLAMTLDDANTPHLCFYDYDAGSLNYAYRNGSDWQIDIVDDDVFYSGQDCSIAIDTLGKPHISYRDLGLQYARYTGSSWQISTVDDDFFAGDGLSLALDSDDKPQISYADWAATDQYDLRYAFSNGSSWWIEIVDSVPSGERFVVTSLALDNDDRPHIGYWQLGIPDILKYAVRDDAPIIYQVNLPMIVR